MIKVQCTEVNKEYYHIGLSTLFNNLALNNNVLYKNVVGPFWHQYI